MNTHLSKEDIQMTKKHKKDMVSIISHYENTNQNHSKIPLHTL